MGIMALHAGKFRAFAVLCVPMPVDAPVYACFPIPEPWAVTASTQFFGVFCRHGSAEVIDVGVPVILMVTTHAVNGAAVIEAIKNFSVFTLRAIGRDFVTEVGVATGAFVFEAVTPQTQRQGIAINRRRIEDVSFDDAFIQFGVFRRIGRIARNQQNA